MIKSKTFLFFFLACLFTLTSKADLIAQESTRSHVVTEYDGKQYNPDYEFGGKVIQAQEKSEIEIKNRLNVGDILELIIPGKLEPIEFTIDKLWDYETDEEIDHVNPGKEGQKVKMILPNEAENGMILRRKK